MKSIRLVLIHLFITSLVGAQDRAINPLIHADVPDVSMIRVGETYYMSSTTMHMSPGVPIMKSTDLVNWELVSYAYDTLADIDATNLENGENMYGRGSWASCLRHVDGLYYLSTFSATAGKTFIFSTSDIENEPWRRHSFKPSLHDNSFFIDDDGKMYLIWGGGELKIAEIKPDLSGVVPGTERVLIENAHAPIKDPIMLPAEGSQLFKVDGKYYLFNIAWPKGGVRTVIIHRADKITDPWEGRVALQDKGVAQGGLIDTPDGRWFSFLFRDNGAVGRIPYLVPVEWKEGWPVLGENGKVPMELDLPANKSLIPGIVASDDFKRKKGDADLPLVWQWNHNPDNDNWKINGKKGYLSLTTGRVDQDILNSRNILTQRTIGPVCTGSTAIDVSKMKERDRSGLILLQKKYGWVGVKYEKGQKYLVMEGVFGELPEEKERVKLDQDQVYLKAIANFLDRKDEAQFFYSLDGKNWKPIGGTLKMAYTLPHFMGYRFGLFNYATKEKGGVVNFDYFQISDQIDK
ncbi:Beta-xylosidase [Reichenbachiella agariperforans]|uniref:Beta-xylosidase n=1 Tax=Reichenbachiella agariperforans TaxID=156994 RepID=A0A1M6KDJ2_REIAG|nr:glycoside hydrolase 43 family protein [Reichenbachiella agariperforans]SHJ57013.1 Beta-xylosidase [Reichenbachiella agariperforans]